MFYLLLHTYFYRVIITIKAKLQKHKTNKETTRKNVRVKKEQKIWQLTISQWEWNYCAIRISKKSRNSVVTIICFSTIIMEKVGKEREGGQPLFFPRILTNVNIKYHQWINQSIYQYIHQEINLSIY